MTPKAPLAPRGLSDPNCPLLGFRLTSDPQSARWGVPTAAPDLGVALIGWVIRDPAIDAGVPPLAATVLALTLARLALVSFLGEPSGAAVAPANRWCATTDGWAARWTGEALLGRGRGPLPMIATRDAAAARAVFLSDAFDWTQQAQIGVLSPPSLREGAPAPPPAMDHADLCQAIERRGIADLLRRRQWLGLVYPGVDGDFAAVVSTVRAFLPTFQDELARSCGQAGLALQTVDEADFGRLPWVGQ